MGFLSGLLGKKHDDKYDWLELGDCDWVFVGKGQHDLEYYYDNRSCFSSGEPVWWKPTIGRTGEEFEYMICGSTNNHEQVAIPICRSLSDPGLQKLKPDVTRQLTTLAAMPLLEKCRSMAGNMARARGLKIAPPYVVFASGIKN